jgi:DNA-directed RNA polymerase specialized sigma subunit
MEKNLETYLKENESLIVSIITTETGTIVRLVPHLLKNNPAAVIKLLNEVGKDFKGDWLGTTSNSLFIPSLATRLKRTLAECVEIADKSPNNTVLIVKKEIIKDKKPDPEESALSHVINDKNEILTAKKEQEQIINDKKDREPAFLNDKKILNDEKTDSQLEKDREEALIIIKNYFMPKSPVEAQNAISFLLGKGSTHNQIAKEVNISTASIYRVASKNSQ